MIVSHLDTTALTHALSVSKYWQQAILGTFELRQTLFLEPQWTGEGHLGMQRSRTLPGWEASILQEPTLSSNMIVATHPALLVEPGPRLYLDVSQVYRIFKSIAPATFITQPPLQKVGVGYLGSIAVQRKEGVRFGDLVEYLGNRKDRSVIRLMSFGVVASDATAVQLAREAPKFKIRAHNQVARE